MAHFSRPLPRPRKNPMHNNGMPVPCKKEFPFCVTGNPYYSYNFAP